MREHCGEATSGFESREPAANPDAGLSVSPPQARIALGLGRICRLRPRSPHRKVRDSVSKKRDRLFASERRLSENPSPQPLVGGQTGEEHFMKSFSLLDLLRHFFNILRHTI
jgi:hypothetical protein